MRVAVVDIGSNSTRLLIGDVTDGRVTAELERRSEVTRLGAGVDADGRLRDDAMERVFATLDRYTAQIDEYRCDERMAVLTSAVRDSANGEQFADVVRTRYGLEPHVLTGDQEARLTFLGATSERDPADATPTLVFDIGGGSTEMVIGTGSEVEFHVSTQAGVVRQTERHVHQDPPTAAECAELSEDVRGILAAAVPSGRRGAVQHAIAVAGTATSLAAIAQDLDPYDPERVHGFVLDASALRADSRPALEADARSAPPRRGTTPRSCSDDHRRCTDLRGSDEPVRARAGRDLRARHPPRSSARSRLGQNG